jgi:DNA-binding CsgD family transcriptional regulator
MNTIYNGKNLEIKFNKKTSTFYQSWLNPDDVDIDVFKKEMLAYTRLYKKYKPLHTVWDQTNFKLELNEDDFEWVELNVNIPCKKYGNKKCAFVVGKDVMEHISVMDSFDEVQSCIKPQHFGSVEDAQLWIDGSVSETENDLELVFKGKNSLGKNVFTLSTDSPTISDLLKNIKSIQFERDFFTKNSGKFLTLSKREVEILKLYGEGHTIKEIHTLLHISEYTARTHWRNIKRKLEISNSFDVQNFCRVFFK